MACLLLLLIKVMVATKNGNTRHYTRFLYIRPGIIYIRPGK